MDEVPSKKFKLSDNTLNNMNDIEAQEESDCEKNVLNSSGENDTLSHSKRSGPCSDEAVARNEPRVSLSDSDYDVLNGCIDFIDKSLFAWHFYHDSDRRLLVTAPSRFGKTSILKMLQKFFGIFITTSSGVRATNVIQKDGIFVEDLSNMSKYFKIFKTKKIFEECHCSSRGSSSAKSCDKCKQWFYEHCGQHPVISISFGTLSTKSLKCLWRSLNVIIRKAFKQHEYLVTEVNGKTVWSSTQNERMGSCCVSTFLKYWLEEDNERYWSNATEDDKESFLINGLPFLAECLSLHFKIQETGKGVILLIDEFDAFAFKMIFEEGEKEEILKNIKNITGFIRDWTFNILKECDFVQKALLMACCAMGGIISLGPNNVQVRRFLDSHPFSESFGFTEDEVKFLLDVYSKEKSSEDKDTMRRDINDWYNGYSVIKTGKKIFSSFSILNYLRSCEIGPYWKDKVGSDSLDDLLADAPFRDKVFRLLDSTKGATSIKIVKNIQPEHILKLNELINKPANVSGELIDLYLQFLTDCGFFNVIERGIQEYYIKIPNLEIDCRIRGKVVSALIKKKNGKFDSSKISAFNASLKSLADIRESLRDKIKSVCLEVAKRIAELYTEPNIPKNHFEIQADLYCLVRDGIDDQCRPEFKIDSGNAPRIDILFKINVNTLVIMEIKHFNSANSVDAALEQILNKKYYKAFLESDNVSNILLGVFLAPKGKISVGCLVNINEENSPEVIMKERICVDSAGKTLFPLNEETQVDTNSNL